MKQIFQIFFLNLVSLSFFIAYDNDLENIYGPNCDWAKLELNESSAAKTIDDSNAAKTTLLNLLLFDRIESLYALNWNRILRKAFMRSTYLAIINEEEASEEQDQTNVIPLDEQIQNTSKTKKQAEFEQSLFSKTSKPRPRPSEVVTENLENRSLYIMSR